MTNGVFRVSLHARALGTLLLASGAAWADQALIVADEGTSAVAFRSQPGRVATFICSSAFKNQKEIWGTDVYYFESAVCTAAVHAGAMAAGTTGQVTIKMGAAAEQLQGTQRNGVTSLPYLDADSTYSFVSNDEAGQISWYTTYDRVPDDFGSPITVLCPPDGDVSTAIIIGTDVYRADSAICVAAVHAGVISRDTGGRVTVTLRPKQESLVASDRNGVSSQAWRDWAYLSYPQPYSVSPGATQVAAPTSTGATLSGPRQPAITSTQSSSVNAAMTPTTAGPTVTAPTERSVLTASPTDSRLATVAPEAPAPTGLTVTGTPTTATVQWLPVAGATGYVVNRADFGTLAWTAVTPAPIAATVSPTDQLTDWTKAYTYQVLAYQADGSFGAATIDYVPAKPRDPSGLAVTAATAASAVISWEPVDGVWEYLVSGPGLTPSAETMTTSFAVVPPGGSGVYQVASIYRPGGVLTPQSSWPSVTASLTAGAPGYAVPGSTSASTASDPSGGGTCACTRTGGFRSPTLRTLEGEGLRGGFSHPKYGSFTVDAQSVNGTDMLDVTDAQGRNVLSVSKPSAWGLSPDYRHFAVAMPPASLNASAPLMVYRVAAGPAAWPTVISTSGYGDGRWGFSAGGKMFLVTRFQNSPIRFTFQAHNLEAANPNAAVVQVSEANVRGPSVTTSPCDDRLMYFRWTQLAPLEGRADFYDRVAFGPNAGSLVTSWDGKSQTTPSASIVAGTGSTKYMVELNGLVVGGGATSFPSLQCNP